MRRFAFVFVTLLVVTPAYAQGADTPAPTIFSTINRTDMIALMQQAGLTAVSDGTTNEESPWVQGTMSTNDTAIIYFYDCEAGVAGPQRHCAHMNFNVYWNNTKNTDAATLNSYNRLRVFGRGSLSEDGKYVTFDYAMNLEGGATGDMIVKNLAYFGLALGDFKSIVNP